MATLENKAFIWNQPLYDTIELAAAAVAGSFFTVPYNGILTGAVLKNSSHTNLIQAGRLEIGNEMMVNALSLYFPSTNDAGALPTQADIRAIHSGNLRWIMGGSTEVLKVPVALVPCGGAELVLFSNEVAAVGLWGMTRGLSAIQNRFPLPEPYLVKSQETIEVIIENMDTIAAPTWVTLVLWGTQARPVR